MKTKLEFTFHSAIDLDRITQVNSTPWITFFGGSGRYINIDHSTVCYIVWEGWHVATKIFGHIAWNPEFTAIPKGFKSALKQII